MSRARDLSKLLGTNTNGVIDNSNITLDANEIPNLDASKITTGELANARIADLPASKITSGTFADARINQSSVSQYVDLSNLNASNLTSGTIPNARFGTNVDARLLGSGNITSSTATAEVTWTAGDYKAIEFRIGGMTTVYDHHIAFRIRTGTTWQEGSIYYSQARGMNTASSSEQLHWFEMGVNKAQIMIPVQTSGEENQSCSMSRVKIQHNDVRGTPFFTLQCAGGKGGGYNSYAHGGGFINVTNQGFISGIRFVPSSGNIYILNYAVYGLTE